MIRVICTESVDEGNQAPGGGLGWIARAVAELRAQDQARTADVRAADPLEIVLDMPAGAVVPSGPDLDPRADGQHVGQGRWAAHPHLVNAPVVTTQGRPPLRPGRRAFRLN